jgi:hypothetical protein
MTGPPDEHSTHPPTTLDYQSGKDRTSIATAVALLMGGALLGAIAPTCLGALLFLGLNYPIVGPGPARSPMETSHVPPFIFAVLLLIAAGSTFLAFRRTDRQWLLIGALLGFGVMCLIEGFCFVHG